MEMTASLPHLALAGSPRRPRWAEITADISYAHPARTARALTSARNRQQRGPLQIFQQSLSLDACRAIRDSRSPIAQTNSSLQRWEPGFTSSFIPLPLPFFVHGGLPPLMMVAAGLTISACQHFSFQLLLPVALCFVFLYLAFAGGGRWSVDAMRRGWKA